MSLLTCAGAEATHFFWIAPISLSLSHSATAKPPWPADGQRSALGQAISSPMPARMPCMLSHPSPCELRARLSHLNGPYCPNPPS